MPSLARKLVASAWRRRPWRREPPLLGEQLLAHISEYKILGERGFYIECGAFDGVAASNTLRLERMGWRGLLVEPSEPVMAICRQTRAADNIFEQCALVSDSTVQTVSGDFDGHPLSSVDGKRRGSTASVSVAARTLQSILDAHGISQVDFFSLDVEGSELDVLRGLDFARNPPTVVVIEVYEEDQREIFALMAGAGYAEPVAMTHFGYWTHAYWDGHNDFLFVWKGGV